MNITEKQGRIQPVFRARHERAKVLVMLSGLDGSHPVSRGPALRHRSLDFTNETGDFALQESCFAFAKKRIAAVFAGFELLGRPAVDDA